MYIYLEWLFYLLLGVHPNALCNCTHNYLILYTVGPTCGFYFDYYICGYFFHSSY